MATAMNGKGTYFEVRKAIGTTRDAGGIREELSLECLSDKEAENWALDLERRGFAANIYMVQRDYAMDYSKKA